LGRNEHRNLFLTVMAIITPIFCFFSSVWMMFRFADQCYISCAAAVDNQCDACRPVRVASAREPLIPGIEASSKYYRIWPRLWRGFFIAALFT
jgi:hypothetical protein